MKEFTVEGGWPRVGWAILGIVERRVKEWNGVFIQSRGAITFTVRSLGYAPGSAGTPTGLQPVLVMGE